MTAEAMDAREVPGLDELLAGVPPGETPDLHGAFPRLEDAQLRALEASGERRQVERGAVLVAEGESEVALPVLLSGRAADVEGFGTADARVVRVHGPGRFLGELGVLTGHKSFVTAVVVDPGEVLSIPADRLRALAAAERVLGDQLLQAFLVRRWLALGEGVGFRIVGSRYSREARQLREFAARNRLPHRFVDLEGDPSAEQLLRQLNLAPEETPIVLYRGRLLRKPTTAELAEAFGLREVSPSERVQDMIVVGAGPAGLAAAVYGASEGLDTLVLEAVAPGGQAGRTSRIENYLGFPSGISGDELAGRAELQAEKFGARSDVSAEVVGMQRRDGNYVLRLADGAEIVGRCVIVATGVRVRRLPVPELETYEDACVYYAATPLEAQHCAGDPVVIVGGGNSAGQAAVFMADHAARVRLVAREAALEENMSRYLADRIDRDPRIAVRLHTEVARLEGHPGRLETVVVKDTVTKEVDRLPARELMVFIGGTPSTSWLPDSVTVDAGGYVVTGPAARRADGAEQGLRDAPLLLETSLPGVFAAGDVRSGSVKRVAVAVGEGAMAVRMVHEYLAATR